jgi:circadian clock protein KaiB
MYMKKAGKLSSPLANFDRRSLDHSKEKYVLELFITGSSSRSILAVVNLKRICEEHLSERYELKIIDLYQQPHLAETNQILAAPTLIKKYPLPARRIIGDMSAREKVLLGLDIREEKKLVVSNLK